MRFFGHINQNMPSRMTVAGWHGFRMAIFFSTLGMRRCKVILCRIGYWKTKGYHLTTKDYEPLTGFYYFGAR